MPHDSVFTSWETLNGLMFPTRVSGAKRGKHNPAEIDFKHHWSKPGMLDKNLFLVESLGKLPVDLCTLP